MNYKQLGNTGFMVSPICLGASQFGTAVSRDFAFWQLDAFTDRGANFIDTAHVYGDWEPGERSRSEKLVGEWLKKSGKRERLIIMSKGAHPFLESMNISRCTPEGIATDINESLQCLALDCIDLYLLHRDNSALPAGLLLEALEKARLEGKIKHYGISNWRLERIKEAEIYARQNGIEGFTCNQLKWSLAEATLENLPDKSQVLMDRDTYAWHQGSGMSVTSYHSTAHGWFTKLEKGQEVQGKFKSLYDNEKNEIIFGRIRQIVPEYGFSALAVSLAYLSQHPFPSVPITSFTRKEQLEEAIDICETKLPESLIAEFNALKGLV